MYLHTTRSLLSLLILTSALSPLSPISRVICADILQREILCSSSSGRSQDHWDVIVCTWRVSKLLGFGVKIYIIETWHSNPDIYLHWNISSLRTFLGGNNFNLNILFKYFIKSWAFSVRIQSHPEKGVNERNWKKKEMLNKKSIVNRYSFAHVLKISTKLLRELWSCTIQQTMNDVEWKNRGTWKRRKHEKKIDDGCVVERLWNNWMSILSSNTSNNTKMRRSAYKYD